MTTVGATAAAAAFTFCRFGAGLHAACTVMCSGATVAQQRHQDSSSESVWSLMREKRGHTVRRLWAQCSTLQCVWLLLRRCLRN